MNEKVVIGQLTCQVSGKSWEYGVVNKIYDGKYEILRQYGGRTMYYIDENSEEFKIKHYDENISTRFLFKNGNPVMAKKKLFGGYKFEAKG